MNRKYLTIDALAAFVTVSPSKRELVRDALGSLGYLVKGGLYSMADACEVDAILTQWGCVRW